MSAQIQEGPCMHRRLACAAVVAEFAAILLPSRSHAQEPAHSQLTKSHPNVRLPVVTTISIHPSADQMAYAGDDHLVRIRSIENDQILFRLEGHTDWIRSVAYSPDGRYLVSAGNDQRVLLWNVATGKLVKVLYEHGRGLCDLAFHPTGNLLACVGFSKSMVLINLTNGKVTPAECPCSDMRCVAFHPTNDRVSAGGRNGIIRTWTTAGALVGEVVAHKQRIRDLIYTRDGLSLCSVGEDRKVRVQSLTSGSVNEWTVDKSKLLSLCEIAAGRLAVGGTDNQVHLFDVPTRKAINVLRQHTGSVSALASRGDYLVTGSFDTSIRWFLASEVSKNKKQANAANVTTPVSAPGDSSFRVATPAGTSIDGNGKTLSDPTNNDEFRIVR